MKYFLKAWLRKNHLTDDPNDYIASVVTNGHVGAGDIIDEIIEDGTDLNRETILNAVNIFNKKTLAKVLSGYTVNTGLVYMRPVIKGALHDKTWNPEVNSVYVTINQGTDMRKATAETSVEILGEQSIPMAIYRVTDTTTGLTDGTLTSGRNAEIKGTYLKIAGDEEACGITFTKTSTGDATRLEATDIVLNEPSRLMIYVPATLEAGEYQLTVTTRYSKGKFLVNEPRSVTFDQPVIIS